MLPVNPVRSQRTSYAVFGCLLLAAAIGCAGAPSSMTELLAATRGDGDVVAGLEQALTVGTRNAVDATSSTDGYLGNPLIRIELPEGLQTMATGLRAVGLGSRVDELDVAMNRAAERAAGEATDVFLAGIREMTFTDAVGILNGGDTAATEYFDRTTRPTLRSRFEPIVAEKMGEVGLVQSYDQLTASYDAIPFTEKPAFDLRDYVTEKTLDGLFTVLGEEERKIRTDPAARVTPLLQQVFGP